MSIDSAQLNFSQDSIWLLNLCLAVVTFGVALGLTLEDFKRILAGPKSVLVGLFSQFILLPLVTFLFILIINPTPSLALGLMLVAACPGGNISNFYSQHAGGDVALSISLTAVSSSFAIIFTPLNLGLWGSLYPPTNNLLNTISIEGLAIFITILQTLLIPLILGMLVTYYKPKLTLKLKRISKPLSLVIFAGFIFIAFMNNMDVFTKYIHLVVLLVLAHNALGFLTGYSIARLFKLSLAQQKTLTIETGIQNSGLALLLVLSFFQNLGGMAVVAGWWGIWHLISGMGLSTYLSKKAS